MDFFHHFIKNVLFSVMKQAISRKILVLCEKIKPRKWENSYFPRYIPYDPPILSR